MPEKNDTPMIELYKVEGAIVHASEMSKNAKIICIIAGIIAALAIIANVFIVQIFTTKYNARTKDWLDTTRLLIERIAVAEVANEYAENIQQFAPP